jgi:hypothetical protein
MISNQKTEYCLWTVGSAGGVERTHRIRCITLLDEGVEEIAFVSLQSSTEHLCAITPVTCHSMENLVQLKMPDSSSTRPTDTSLKWDIN